MEIGFVGLGRMGGNMAARLKQHDHTVFGMDPSAETRALAEKEGIPVTDSLTGLADMYQSTPRVFWAMVPSGKITDAVLNDILTVAQPGDIVVDGGNTHYKDSVRHAAEFAQKQVHFLDCGTSGGIWGLQNGYCLMIGGPEEAFKIAEPIFRDLAPQDGYLRSGPSGAGHFVKMVHNGIEYGMLQAYAEGFELLRAAEEFQIDLSDTAHLWNQGSVVRSWLLELAERALGGDEELPEIKGYVQDSGEGRWTVEESVDRAVPLPVITLSLQMRFRSRQDDSYGAKVIAALRNQFGGHAITAKKKEETHGETQPSGGVKDL